MTAFDQWKLTSGWTGAPLAPAANRGMQITTVHIGRYTVLFGNDRERDEELDAWKFKVVAPLSTWSVAHDTYQAAYDAALLDIRTAYVKEIA